MKFKCIKIFKVYPDFLTRSDVNKLDHITLDNFQIIGESLHDIQMNCFKTDACIGKEQCSRNNVWRNKVSTKSLEYFWNHIFLKLFGNKAYCASVGRPNMFDWLTIVAKSHCVEVRIKLLVLRFCNDKQRLDCHLSVDFKGIEPRPGNSVSSYVKEQTTRNEIAKTGVKTFWSWLKEVEVEHNRQKRYSLTEIRNGRWKLNI